MSSVFWGIGADMIFAALAGFGFASGAKPPVPAYPKHGQKTGKHKNAYQKPQQKPQNDLIQKAKNMSREEKAALLAALLE